jgi:integrase
MNDTARAALSEARTGAITPFVVEWAGKPVATVKKGLQAAGRRARLPWVTAHVFRHSVASWLAQDGIDLRKIAEMLGHADSRTTERIYSRFTPDFLADAAKALEIDMIRECSDVAPAPNKVAACATWASRSAAAVDELAGME